MQGRAEGLQRGVGGLATLLLLLRTPAALLCSSHCRCHCSLHLPAGTRARTAARPRPPACLLTQTRGSAGAWPAQPPRPSPGPHRPPPPAPPGLRVRGPCPALPRRGRVGQWGGRRHSHSRSRHEGPGGLARGTSPTRMRCARCVFCVRVVPSVVASVQPRSEPRQCNSCTLTADPRGSLALQLSAPGAAAFYKAAANAQQQHQSAASRAAPNAKKRVGGPGPTF